jgi:7,8-dihydropterin-6-yl-methyl-4-(beta-D-ribofuranosyl)aminobenzene 5'-phosphate synthase
MESLNFRKADRLEITILVDNYTDLLLLRSTEVVQRANFQPPNTPLAEHGFSCLIKVGTGSEEYSVLMDAGVSAACVLHNAGLLKAELKNLAAVVLSHGHADHFGGLPAVLQKGGAGVPLYLHPEAFLKRRLKLPGTPNPVDLPALDEHTLAKSGADLRRSGDAATLASGLVLVTGEIERTTDFERGFPWAEAKINARWVADPFHDDQALVFEVKDKGLVVLGGCSHAGIINTVRHARKITGAGKVHAVLGGFHLTGEIFEPVIDPTIEALKKIGPDYIVPMHCTGWKAISKFAARMPEQFVLNTVGTTYVF